MTTRYSILLTESQYEALRKMQIGFARTDRVEQENIEELLTIDLFDNVIEIKI